MPYPVNLIEKTPIKIDYSYRDHALVEVALLPRDGAKVAGKKVKGQIFYLELRAFGKGKNRHWLVVDWVPRGRRASHCHPPPANRPRRQGWPELL